MLTHKAISAYILARDEEKFIGDAIKSLAWVNEIIVIDTGSQDATRQVAEQCGAKVIDIPFTGFGHVRNQALTKCSHDWIFCLDADERCTPELQQEILTLLDKEKSARIFLAPRCNYFMGRWIKHSGWYPDYRHPVFFNKQNLKYTDDSVHESFITKDPVHTLKHAFIHNPYANLAKMVSKTNHYSTLGVARLEKKKKTTTLWWALAHAYWTFIRQYFFRLGFLDGWPGYILAMNGFNSTFYRYAKYIEKQQQTTQSN